MNRLFIDNQFYSLVIGGGNLHKIRVMRPMRPRKADVVSLLVGIYGSKADFF